MIPKAKEIIIKTKKRLFGANIGNNVSIFQGSGLDFSEIREYRIGDDVKKINWKVTARVNKPHVNVFYEERELNIVFCFLVSGSIYFGSVRQKQELMSEILTLVGFSAVKNSDKFHAIFFDEKVIKRFAPTKSQKLLYAILEEALILDALGKKVDFEALQKYLLHTLKQKSIIFLVGDFLQDEIDLSLLGAKHEVYAVIVRDKFEEEPKLTGENVLIDLESLQEFEMEIDETIIKQYQKILQEHDEKLKVHFLLNKIEFVKIYTNEDPFFKLANLFRAK